MHRHKWSISPLFGGGLDGWCECGATIDWDEIERRVNAIESLRNVARAAQMLDLLRLADWIRSVQGSDEDWEWPQDIGKLQEALDALSPWVLEE